MTHDKILDPKFIAGVDLLGRTGAKNFRIGWSDEDDGPPIVWYACAEWTQVKARAGVLEINGAEAAAALDPVNAVMRLCERVIDGGTCDHCHQFTIFDDSDPMGTVTEELLDKMGCRYAWDPELKTFRRSCEGDN